MEKKSLSKEELVKRVRADKHLEDSLKKKLIENIEKIFDDEINWSAFLFTGVFLAPFSAYFLPQSKITDLWDEGIIRAMQDLNILSNKKDGNIEVFDIRFPLGILRESSINPKSLGEIMYFITLKDAEEYAEAYKKHSDVKKVKIYRSEEIG